MRVTADASVAVKWFVAEGHRREARHLLAPGIERYAPDLLPVQCANAVWKKARRGEIGSADPFLEGIAEPTGRHPNSGQFAFSGASRRKPRCGSGIQCTTA